MCNIFICLYVYDMFHILLSCDSLGDIWNACMYMYVCMLTLALPSTRNVKYDEKQLTGKKIFLTCSFYLYRFHKYVSYGFPVINCCNPRVHYETPCIY